MNKKTFFTSAIVTFTILSQTYIIGKKKLTYPKTTKSPICKVQVTKNIEQRKVEVINEIRPKKPIYVYVDYNYRTKKFGGGHDKKTTARKIPPGFQATFILHVPKNEEVAIRWTKDKNLKTATWYETHYFNEKYKHITVMKTDGYYLKTIKVAGKKMPETILEKANTITFTASHKKLPTPPRPKTRAPRGRPEDL